jgi:hypothetical protein
MNDPDRMGRGERRGRERRRAWNTGFARDTWSLGALGRSEGPSEPGGEAGREALLKCAHLASALERVTRGPDGLVRERSRWTWIRSRCSAVSRRRYPHRACPPSGITKRVIPFGTRGCSRRRVSCGPVSRRSRRLLQNPPRTCPRARAEAPTVRGRSFSNGPLGSTF